MKKKKREGYIRRRTNEEIQEDMEAEKQAKRGHREIIFGDYEDCLV